MKTKTINQSLIAFSIFAIMILLFVTCKKKEENNQNEQPTYTNGEGIIGSNGGTVIIDDASSPIRGASIYIPAGALNTNVNVKISQPSGVYLPDDSSSIVVEFTPKNTQFIIPVTLGIPYISNADTSKLNIFYYDPDSLQIVQMHKKRVDIKNKIVYGETKHFSYFTIWDQNHNYDYQSIGVEMFKIADKIGARLQVNNLPHYLVTTAYLLEFGYGSYNAWLALEHDDRAISSFHVILKEEGAFFDSPVASVFLYVKKTNINGNSYSAAVYLLGDETPRYIANNLNTDINKLFWFTGTPLVFNFKNAQINPNKRYYIEVRWALAFTDPEASPLFRITRKYVFNNETQMKKVNEMEAFSTVFNDYLDSRVASGNQAPDQPTNPDPPQGATNVSTHASISWDCSDPDINPMVYDIYFGTSSTPPLVQSDYNGTTYTPTSLLSNTKYFWIITAKDNRGGETQGTKWHFTTSSNSTPTKPIVYTNAITNKTQTSATSGGNVTSDGGAIVTEKGICWSTSANPTILNNPISGGTGTGSYVCNIMGLNPSSTYHVRAYATNSEGTSYGDDVSFITNGTTALSTDLISYWKLDETSGSIAYDSHGSNDCTVQDGVTINENGLIHKAASFIETSGGLTTDKTAPDLGIEGETSKSVSIWIKPDPSINGLNSSGIINLGSRVDQQQFGIKFYGAAPYWMFDSWYGAVRITPDGENLADGIWHHIVVAYSANDHTVRTYLDGVLVTADGSKVLSTGDEMGFSIGIGSQGKYAGVIDEVGLWRRALSSNEVYQLYNNGNGLTYPF